MKILNTLFLFISLTISFALSKEISAWNYEITFYGGSDDGNSELNPSCEISIGDYYAALSVYYDWRSVCGQYAIVMLTNGSPNMVKAKIVDSCGNCDKYHVDLSKKAFSKLLDRDKGVGNVIWGIYSKSGQKIKGPYENKGDSVASKFNLSYSSFISAFDANAQQLAVSSSYSKTFDPSGRSGSSSGSSSGDSRNTTTRRTTTRRTTTRRTTTSRTTTSRTTTYTKRTTTTTRIITTKNTTTYYNRPSTYAKSLSNNYGINYGTSRIPNNNGFGTPTTKSVPVQNAVGTTSLPPKLPPKSTPNVNNATNTTLPPNTNSNKFSTPTPAIIKDELKEGNNNKKDNDGNSKYGVAAAIGGGVLGAAGLSLLLVKKKSPRAYEGLKRRATSLKRKVTRKGSTVPTYSRSSY